MTMPASSDRRRRLGERERVPPTEGRAEERNLRGEDARFTCTVRTLAGEYPARVT